VKSIAVINLQPRMSKIHDTNHKTLMILGLIILNNQTLRTCADENFGTSHSPLLHNIISLFPVRCQIFVLSDHILNSETFNGPHTRPAIQYASSNLDGKMRYPSKKLVKNVQCRIVVLNLKMKYTSKHKRTHLFWWIIHFKPIDEKKYRKWSRWSYFYLGSFGTDKPSFVLSLIPDALKPSDQYLTLNYPYTRPFSQHDSTVFLTLPKK